MAAVPLIFLGLILWVTKEANCFILNAGSSIPPGLTLTTGGKISLNGGDVILRGSSVGGTPIRLKEGAVVVGDTLICNSYMNVVDNKEPIYQKSPDGSRWYANVNVGVPMSRAEAEEFEKDWPRFATGRADRIEKALTAAKDPNWSKRGQAQGNFTFCSLFSSILPSFSGWW